jgi:hypothetical protein
MIAAGKIGMDTLAEIEDKTSNKGWRRINDC